MKKTIAISATSLLLFVASLLITIQHIRELAMAEAEITAQKFNDRTSKSLDAILTNGKLAAYSLLSGYFYSITPSQFKDSSSQVILKHSRFVIAEEDQNSLSEDGLYHTLEDFLRVNANIHSAVFFMEPDAFPNLPFKYRAPMVYRDFDENQVKQIQDYEKKTLKSMDLSEKFDFRNRKFYKESLDSTYETLWSKNSWSNEKNRFLISYYVPIVRKNGKMLGVFSMCMPLQDYAINSVKNGLPYNGSYMDIYDQNGSLLLSTSTDVHDASEFLHFETLVKSNNWKIITRIPEKQAYAAATYIQIILWIMSILSIIFVSIEATSIFQFLRKNAKQREALENELKLANKIQMDILNPANFETDKFELNAILQPAKDVGGDLYDYFLYKPKDKDEHTLLYFIVGDVSGKGMPAALMMTQVCSLFRDIVRFKHSPEEILQRINEVLAERNDLLMFCTAFLGVIDLETYEMTYANAGHDKPVIIPVSPDGKPRKKEAYYLEMKPNVPLAIMGNGSFKGGTIQLQKGSQIVTYTDGITESMSKTKVQFGEVNLLRTLQNGDSLMDAVKNHAIGAEQSDDITILKISL